MYKPYLKITLVEEVSSTSTNNKYLFCIVKKTEKKQSYQEILLTNFSSNNNLTLVKKNIKTYSKLLGNLIPEDTFSFKNN